VISVRVRMSRQAQQNGRTSACAIKLTRGNVGENLNLRVGLTLGCGVIGTFRGICTGEYGTHIDLVDTWSVAGLDPLKGKSADERRACVGVRVAVQK
jgi:hypothetical protein